MKVTINPGIVVGKIMKVTINPSIVASTCNHFRTKNESQFRDCGRCRAIEKTFVNAGIENDKLKAHLKDWMWDTPSGNGRKIDSFMKEFYRLAPEEFPMIAAADIYPYSETAKEMLEGGKPKRRLSRAALCSAHIKKTVKDRFGVVVRAKSSNFSGGNSVHVEVPRDVSESVFQQIESLVGEYQYGSFDGMTDSYEYSNNRDDIPQVKYTGTGRFY